MRQQHRPLYSFSDEETRIIDAWRSSRELTFANAVWTLVTLGLERDTAEQDATKIRNRHRVRRMAKGER